jgi:hypothetical protein
VLGILSLALTRKRPMVRIHSGLHLNFSILIANFTLDTVSQNVLSRNSGASKDTSVYAPLSLRHLGESPASEARFPKN